MESVKAVGRRIGIAMAAILGLGMGSAHAGLLLTVEAPGVQQTSVAGVVTETFDDFDRGSATTLNTAVGVIESENMQIKAADQYGGAGGTGNYLAIGGGNSPTTLTFSTAQSYFGFWWSAADASNAFSIYSGSTLLAHFDPTTALSYLSSDYNGNPTEEFEGQASTEKFAYLNFFGTEGTTFDRIVFTNYNSGSRLELDNISIRTQAVVDPPGEPIGGVEAIPEPSSIALAGAAMTAAILFGRRQVSRGR